MLRTLSMMVAAVLLILTQRALADCGDRGGPGYRAPDGHCVGWAELRRICGNPPATKCNPERPESLRKQGQGSGIIVDTPTLNEPTVPNSDVGVQVRPNKDLTGGSVRTVKPDEACGHAKQSRGQMSADRRDEILRRYKLPIGTHPDYEIDHLIPLCLGGSDDASNLWPQPRRSIQKAWSAERKDRLERLMCDMVCAGQIDIAAAQAAFATDWIAAYQTYYEEGKDGRSRNRLGHLSLLKEDQ